MGYNGARTVYAIRDKGYRDGNSSENSIPRGIKEWKFNIPRGLRKIKSIPQGSLGPVGILELRYQKLCNTVLMMDVS